VRHDQIAAGAICEQEGIAIRLGTDDILGSQNASAPALLTMIIGWWLYFFQAFSTVRASTSLDPPGA